MARGKRRSEAEWLALGRAAIQCLLLERRVVPWAEAEAKLGGGWKDFPPIQPLQLSFARKDLRAEGSIEEDRSGHDYHSVTTLRFPIAPGEKRRIERLRGQRRRLYRKYLKWAGDQDLCGKQGERVILASLEASASEAGLYVPPQTLGDLREVDGVLVLPGPLDIFAWILNLDAQPVAELPLVLEVKNTRGWIYQKALELWQLLVKAANIAASREVLPVLACMRSAYQTLQMAKDIGFFSCETRVQIFRPTLPETEFQEVKEDFGLPIELWDGPIENVVSFLTKQLRRTPPPTPSPANIPWYRQQADRFSALAPIVLNHSVLADETGPDTRRRAFDSFRAEVKKAATWDLVGGW